ncbi:CpsB/CapC family capsule biosynthesis tyrosine phosphatase [Salegentibacter sp. F188]|uniref:protein-tyrosine-phosphatase n=1 Tax=Autumnicola patrickiae TaxID=3075591 RepID=A0ABU3E1H4_9FLAO|nr:CpsB/CapC family capsule biosynthesis tyrosine phosphatase [Salegentibacter sp. F188]MDT0689844.1 CpsB/CapC family capsule biosynthesis tyrosine phosphatase [Salegentibacter sp. F188]
MSKNKEMLSIFQKKRYLADNLDGFTDFHNHLLPGIDDGSNSVEETINLISEFGKFGVKNFVSTPHVMGEYYPNTPETINEALNLAKTNLPATINIKAAAEYMMDQHFLEILESNQILSINDKHVLVEMSYFQPPININEILFKLQNKSFKPILAHPERYPYLYSKSLHKFEELKSRGCRLQLNMLSLTRHYGPGIQKIAMQLLEKGLIDFLSSDCHRMEHLIKIQTIRLPYKKMNLLHPVLENSKNLF